MRILGIETSCDETAVAVVEGDLGSKRHLRTVSSVVSSSAELHAKYGGIIPEQAARQQVKVMIPVLWECLEQHAIKIRETDTDKEKIRRAGQGIDAIAITVGPGLVGSLLVGVETARTLAYLWRKPIIPVNHLVAHLYANWIEPDVSRVPQVSRVSRETISVPEFPVIGLVVSGGHTDMVLMKSHESLKLIGSTRDDAAGECFDKCARMLGLPYPGGPEIARLAEQHILCSSIRSKKLVMFPRPLSGQKNFDWSFSGLKTSVLYYLQKIKGTPIDEVRRFGTGESDQNNQEELGRISAEIQEAICDSLVTKLKGAIEKFKPKSVLVAGGVAANGRLAEKLVQLNKLGDWRLFVPPPNLCTDNGGYIAAYAFYHYSPSDWRKIHVQPGLTVTTRV